MESKLALRPKNIKLFYPTVISLMMATRCFIKPEIAVSQRSIIEFVAHKHSNMLELIKDLDTESRAEELERAYETIRQELFTIYGSWFTDYSGCAPIQGPSEERKRARVLAKMKLEEQATKFRRLDYNV